MEFTGMDNARIAAILKSLAAGVDPHSGAPLIGTFQHADTVRALVAAVAIVESPAQPAPTASTAPTAAAKAAAPKKPQRALPGNAGKPWTNDEDAQLLAAFDGGEPVADIALAHSRSRLAIEARLARFGRMPMPAGVRQRNAAAPGTEPTTARDESVPTGSHGGNGFDTGHDLPPPVVRDSGRPRYRVAASRAVHA